MKCLIVCGADESTRIIELSELRRTTWKQDHKDVTSDNKDFMKTYVVHYRKLLENAPKTQNISFNFGDNMVHPRSLISKDYTDFDIQTCEQGCKFLKLISKSWCIFIH
jgi:hypothetical protein